ncbi:MAG: 2-amino-4-hydroxy-6-hydroxymethyldihydropteridine diphosphokinase [Bacillota bacterium]
METVYLGLGTNIGAKEKNLRKAVNLLKQTPGLKLIQVSSIYETAPWGYEEQNNFLNLCLELKTELEPQELLTVCQKVENDLGRVRNKKWGPRIIDVDILTYDDLKINTPKLIIPHPRIKERAFVLVPLQDLNTNLLIDGHRIEEYLAEISTAGIEHYSNY